MPMMNEKMTDLPAKIHYEVTGRVAHSRISPLLPPHWIDVSPSVCEKPHEEQPDFLWENAPKHETKAYRDTVKVYSHLPNGSAILDSKWVLGRMLGTGSSHDSHPHLATLETHCFQGVSGFEKFCHTVNLFQDAALAIDASSTSSSQDFQLGTFPDLLSNQKSDQDMPKPPHNFWVLKDSSSNGAGGIWIVGPENCQRFCNSASTPLYDNHRYVAQRYTWPPVLYGGRKCHVRVYGLLTADGRAFCHQRCFLHVANDTFEYTSNGKHDTTKNQHGSDHPKFDDSVHITNCCANSHDDHKFAGEILADLEATEWSQDSTGQKIVPLKQFFPSIQASLAAFAQATLPFCNGGQANNGMEYLGMDFILSYRDQKPVAYMLEINAPPSQDTATGLPHAEDLHNEVLRDLISLCVIPKVTGAMEVPGKWICVYNDKSYKIEDPDEAIVPSKATILNKIRWTLFERKLAKAQAADEQKTPTTIIGTNAGTQHTNDDEANIAITKFCRSQFPYFDDASLSAPRQVFFENAGGSQVPRSVIHGTVAALQCRHRERFGKKSTQVARETLRAILGASHEHSVFLGANATSLISTLAVSYARQGLLKATDEIVICTENHLANVEPWVQAAELTGAKVKWWRPFVTNMPDATSESQGPLSADSWSSDLAALLNTSTRIVAISHASNMLGELRDLNSLQRQIEQQTQGHGHCVVDGVAAAPHVYPSIDEAQVDWYAVSCHKLFGPHIGALCGSPRVTQSLTNAARQSTKNDTVDLFKMLEVGTLNYEACSGLIGLGHYFCSLASLVVSAADSQHPNEKIFASSLAASRSPTTQVRCESTVERNISFDMDRPQAISTTEAQLAYRWFREVESKLILALTKGLERSSKVQLLASNSETIETIDKLPLVSFVHETIPPSEIVSFCEQNGIACRSSTFLSTEWMAQDFGFDLKKGVVRVSLAHYNTLKEVSVLLDVLESMTNWYS